MSFSRFLGEIETSRHEYRLATSQKFHYLALAAIFLVSAGFFFKLGIDPVGREFALAVGVLLLIPGVILVSLALRSRLILDGDRIELRSAWRTFTADRSEIEGVRKFQNRYDSWVRICLRENGGSFNVSESFTGNDELRKWLRGLPDLDKRDAALITQQVRHQDFLGGAESRSLNVFKQAKAWMIGLSVATGVISILALFNYIPLHSLSMVLLSLIPPVGILLIHRFPRLFTVFKAKVDPRSDMAFVIFTPGIVMGISEQYRTRGNPTHLVEPFQLIYWTLLILLCYVAALFPTAWKCSSRWGALIGVVILGGMYGVGVVNVANTLPDRAVPHVYSTVVLKMYETTGKNASSYLRVAPWGPISYNDDVVVPKHIYRETKVGDQICLGLHPGFLRAPWYTLIPCPGQIGAPTQ